MLENQTKPTRPSDGEYIKFVGSLQLIGLGLKSSSAIINRKVFFELLKEKQVDRRMAETYASAEIGADFFEAEGRFEVTIADGAQIGLQIQCVFEVHMHAPKPIDLKMVERFSSSDLRFVLLPYARQFVTNVTSQMDIPAIVLPLATAAGKARPRRTKERMGNIAKKGK